MGDTYSQVGVANMDGETASFLEGGHPVDVNKKWGERSVKECRAGELTNV